MKKFLMVAITLIASVSIFAQKQITYNEMKTFSKGMFEAADFDSYVGADGHSYKIGDTLKLGRPSSNKTFAFIEEGTGALGALAGTPPQPTTASSSGTNSIIKRIYVGGSKRMGFRIYFVGKGVCGMCPQYYINVEEAMAVGELKSFGMSREDAIAKLKEQKDLLDLGMITKEQFEKIKTELTPIVMKSLQ
jgi:hypothetical protein